MKNTLTQGAVKNRPKQGKSQIHNGIHPLSSFTHRTQRFQPLPMPLGEPPYHFDIEAALPGITKLAGENGKIVFHTVGDTGGIKHGEAQMAVASAMKNDLAAENSPSFFYHLGDVVYYNGEPSEYYSQFYEPYDHYQAPILGIPGNHDGDPVDANQTSLDGWVQFFMTEQPHIDPISMDAPRVTMSLPNVYYTVECPFVNIVGMYTNVPEHGSIDSVQQQWLTNEFNTADPDKALIVALHHPIYSFDDHHSGSPAMADALQHAINDSRRIPNMVLTAHVHNYQRIEKDVSNGLTVPFLVCGHGGYYHLHHLNAQNGNVDEQTNAKLISGHEQHGYVTITVDSESISGSMTLVNINNTKEPMHDVDTFEYSAKAMYLPKDVVLSL